MKRSILTAMALWFAASSAGAHGENSLGPNKGYIRMPGAYHTEVVPQGDSSFRVYLLDINWKNPSVKSSSVKAQLTDKKTQNAECKVKDNFFHCSFGTGVKLNQGNLVLETTRENQKGSLVSYPLPLKVDGDAHKNH